MVTKHQILFYQNLNVKYARINMIEAIKHLLGLCGEPHGLIYILFTASGLTTLLAYIKLKLNRKTKD